MKELVDKEKLLKLIDRLSVDGYDGNWELIRRTPVRDAIRHCEVSPAELAKEINALLAQEGSDPCPVCKGKGQLRRPLAMRKCLACDGTGKKIPPVAEEEKP